MSEPTPQRGMQRPTQRPPQRRKIYTGENQFMYDHSRVPKDMAYQWKRISIAGMEDRNHQVITEMNGWTPVPAGRHPELMGRLAAEETPNAPIIRGGQMLMEQPKEYEQESRGIDEFTARQTLEQNVQRFHGQAKRQGGKGVSRSREVISELVE